MAFISVYRKDTGEKQLIPEHFLNYKKLAEPFRKTPPTAKPAGTEKAPASAGTTTKKEG